MSELRDFIADLLERKGGAVEASEPDGLAVLAPAPVREAMGWPELARLGFGTERAPGALPIGLEGDWLDKFAALLADEGRWSEREGKPVADVPPSSDPEPVLDRALDRPDAVLRFQGVSAPYTRCLMLAFRYTAVSDERREGLIWLGFNLGTGAVVSDIFARQRPILTQMHDWKSPDRATRLATGAGWSAATREVRESMEPFLRAMRRRLERDRNRVHAYHDELRNTSLKRIAALAQAQGERAETDRRRETLRVEAIEREYRAKLDDLRHNYALRVTAEWVQALDLYVPVQRFEVLIRRRKGER